MDTCILTVFQLSLFWYALSTNHDRSLTLTPTHPHLLTKSVLLLKCRFVHHTLAALSPSSYQVLVVVLTFLCYMSYHMTRKTISVVKVRMYIYVVRSTYYTSLCTYVFAGVHATYLMCLFHLNCSLNSTHIATKPTLECSMIPSYLLSPSKMSPTLSGLRQREGRHRTVAVLQGGRRLVSADHIAACHITVSHPCDCVHTSIRMYVYV